MRKLRNSPMHWMIIRIQLNTCCDASRNSPPLNSQLLPFLPAVNCWSQRRITDKSELSDKNDAVTARALGEQLQTLLFLAREQGLGVTEPVAVAECVFDAVEPICSEMYRKKLKFEVNIHPSVTLVVNRQALHTALMNLLRNAVQYTESGFIHVEFKFVIDYPFQIRALE